MLYQKDSTVLSIRNKFYSINISHIKISAFHFGIITEQKILTEEHLYQKLQNKFTLNLKTVELVGVLNKNNILPLLTDS